MLINNFYRFEIIFCVFQILFLEFWRPAFLDRPDSWLLKLLCQMTSKLGSGSNFHIMHRWEIKLPRVGGLVFHKRLLQTNQTWTKKWHWPCCWELAKRRKVVANIESVGATGDQLAQVAEVVSDKLRHHRMCHPNHPHSNIFILIKFPKKDPAKENLGQQMCLGLVSLDNAKTDSLWNSIKSDIPLKKQKGE